jgi:porin
MVMRGIGWICLAVLFGFVRPASADDDGWLTRSTLTGDWGGVRTTLADHGVTFESTELMTFQANAGGVPRSNHRTAFASQFNLINEIDFEKLAGIPGFVIHSEFWWQAGSSLNARDIAGLYEVSPAYGPNGILLGQLYAQQTLLDGGLEFRIGRLSADSTFATLPVFTDYLNTVINGVPGSIPLNAAVFTTAPAVEWGATVTFEPTETLQLAAGIYATDGPSAEPQASTNGTHFALHLDEGVFAVGQVTYKLNQAKDDTGLPGTYSIGGFFAGNDYADLKDGREGSGNYGFYALAQQMVYRTGEPGSDAGLTPWLAIAVQPQQDINEVPFSIAAGATWKGLIPGRDDDTAALMVAYSKISNTQAHMTGEVDLELAYTLAATPWLAVTPDFQYIVNPGGDPNANNAAVFGAQMSVTF